MRSLKDKKCLYCKRQYTPRSSRQKYCGERKDKSSCNYKMFMSDKVIWARNNRIRMRELKNYYNSLPEERLKNRARAKVQRSIKSGYITKPDTCMVNEQSCNGKIEGHHSDYTEPLKVDWLCKIHHEQIHHKGLKVERVNFQTN